MIQAVYSKWAEKQKARHTEGAELFMQQCLCISYVLPRLSYLCIRVYSKYQYSIFVSFDIRAGRTQRRKESEFAIRVSGRGAFRVDFASPVAYIIYLTLVHNVAIISLFSHQVLCVIWPMLMLCFARDANDMVDIARANCSSMMYVIYK